MSFLQCLVIYSDLRASRGQEIEAGKMLVLCSSSLQCAKFNRKKSSLPLWQMPYKLNPDVGCPDEDLVIRKMLCEFWLEFLF